MLRKALLGLSVGGAAGAAYSMRYSFEEELTHPHKLLTTLQSDRRFTQLEASPDFDHKTPTIMRPLAGPGGIGAFHTFIDKHQPSHTVSYIYAGSRTNGFPFVVHGGIIGTLLTEVFDTASQNGQKWTDLHISYMSPTFTNQFLVVETSYADKYLATIRNTDGKVLVRATAA